MQIDRLAALWTLPIGAALSAAEPPAQSARSQDAVRPSPYRVPPRPIYLEDALRNDYEGVCRVTFVIDAAGVPQDIQPACNYMVFDDAAREAVAATRINMAAGFTPGMKMALCFSSVLEEARPPEPPKRRKK